MTVAQVLGVGRAALLVHGPSARREAGLLLGHVLDATPAWLLAHGDAAVDEAVMADYARAVARRAAGEPLAYIVGHVGFYGRSFAVTPDVLVPRPESEQLIAGVLDALADSGRVRICDVGTGSGILAVTLAAELPRATLVAVDRSAAALTVARRNAAALDVAARITFCRSNMLDGLAAHDDFDAIIANLPYVRTADLPAAPDPTSFEPRCALDGGSDGLVAYRAFLCGAPRHLRRNGILLMEAGPDTVAALARMAQRVFEPTARVRTLRDYAGLLRIVEVRRSPSGHRARVGRSPAGARGPTLKTNGPS